MKHSLKRTIELKYFIWAFFYFHLALFVGSNTLLIITNFLVSPRALWFIIPLAGWGVCLFVHFLATFFLISDSAKQWRNAQVARNMEEEKRLGIDEQEAKRHASTKFFFWMVFYFHGALYLGSNTVMVLINVLVDRTFLWSIIPIIGWGFWLLFHFLLTFLCLGDQIKAWREQRIERLMFKELTSENHTELYRDAFIRYFLWALFYMHLGLYVFCNIMMIIIDLTNDPNIWWCVWPLLAWGLFVLGHFGFTYATASELMVKWREEQLKKLSDQDQSF